MGVKVLKKDDGFWLSFDSSKGKHALVHISRLCVDNGGIITKAILETCAECNSDTLVENSNSAESKPVSGGLPEYREHNNAIVPLLEVVNELDACHVLTDKMRTGIITRLSQQHQ